MGKKKPQKIEVGKRYQLIKGKLVEIPVTYTVTG